MTKRLIEFEAVALPHLDAAYRLARWLARSPADADDIVQEAMLKAFAAYETAGARNIRPWLMTIVRNVFHDHRRRRAWVAPDSEDRLAALPDEAPSPEQAAEGSSDKRRLERLIARLPDAYREALVLRELEDMSYQEIADAVGAPIGTVMSRLARARRLLKDAWLRSEEP